MKNKWMIKGDHVRVISGNDRGKVGKVLARKKERIVVQGVNIRKRHMKSRDQNQKSDIVSMEMPIHISNVMLCDANGEKLALKVKLGDKKAKDLIYFKNGNEIHHRSLKKSGK